MGDVGSYSKRVLLTADGDDVSKAIARSLLRHGCRLVLMGDEEALGAMAAEISSSVETNENIKVVGVRFATDDEATFDEAVARAWSLLGGLDAFVNCYTYEGEIQDCLDISEAEFEKTVKINVMVPWFLLKAVAKRLRDVKTGGSIVFLTQIIAAERGLYPGAAAFGSTLASVQQLVRLAALELGKHNIRVNAVSRGLRSNDKFPVSVGEENILKRTKAAMPLKRWLQPEDLSSTILYLIGDDACYMTGTSIYVDGAQSIVRPRMRSYM